MPHRPQDNGGIMTMMVICNDKDIGCLGEATYQLEKERDRYKGNPRRKLKLQTKYGRRGMTEIMSVWVVDGSGKNQKEEKEKGLSESN